MKLPKFSFKTLLAIGAVAVSLGFPSLAPVVSHMITSYQTQSINSEILNITTDPQTKKTTFGCSHLLKGGDL